VLAGMPNGSQTMPAAGSAAEDAQDLAGRSPARTAAETAAKNAAKRAALATQLGVLERDMHDTMKTMQAMQGLASAGALEPSSTPVGPSSSPVQGRVEAPDAAEPPREGAACGAPRGPEKDGAAMKLAVSVRSPTARRRSGMACCARPR
jgi:hypothetical protein